jgi:hypothetical protein
MHIVSDVLTERTDPAKKQQFGQWLLRVVEETKPQYEEAVAYLHFCLSILKRCAETAAAITPSLFWFGVSFLRCSAPEYYKLFVANPAFTDLMRAGGPGQDLLRLMLAIKSDEKAAISSIFQIVYSLLSRGLVDTLGKEASTRFLAIFAVVPALWGHCKKPDEAVEIAQSLAKLAQLPESQALIRDISAKRSTKAVGDLSKLLISRLTQGDLQLLFGFGAQVVKGGTVRQREGMYAIANEVFKIDPKVGQLQEMTNIAYSAATDADHRGSAIVRGLLRSLMKGAVVAQNSVRLAAKKTFSPFPTLPKADVGGKALYSSFDAYPPFYLTDTGFSGSEVLAAVKGVVDQISEVQPLDEWHKSVRQAHAQVRLMRARQEQGRIDINIQQTFFADLKVAKVAPQ